MSHIDNVQGAERLMQALVALHTREECHSFLEDICTIKEIQDISQRLEVASMLQEGKNYQTVSNVTGASTATICRVSKCLNYGTGGYKTILDRMDKEN